MPEWRVAASWLDLVGRIHPLVRSALNKFASGSSFVTTIPPSMVVICEDEKLKLPIAPKEPTFFPFQTTPRA